MHPCVRPSGTDGRCGAATESFQYALHFALHRARVRLPLPTGELPAFVLRHEQNGVWLHVTGKLSTLKRCINQGNYDHAIRDQRTALAVGPHCALARERNYTFTNTLGTLLFREGQYARSVQVIDEGCAMSAGGAPGDWLVLAMANYRLGRTAEAQKWLDKAAQAIGVRARQKPTHPQWIDLLEWRIMLAEARQLLDHAAK